MDTVPGWYGKLPALGDFASRRLSQSFIQPWDAWLQQGIAESRARLGERWLDTFLTSSIWRFVLGPECVTPTAWAGVLLPSVDRVGRYFPLTIAAPYISCSEVTDWFPMLESAAHVGLGSEDIDHFDRTLTVSPAPAPSRGPLQFIPLATAALNAEQTQHAANQLLSGLLTRHTLWLTTNTQGQQTGFVTAGMPSAQVFTGMLEFSAG